MAEIRSLAVYPEFIGQGIGSALAERAIQEAVYFKIKDLFTLTYRPDFFKRFGFLVIDKSELPVKVWSDCIGCVSYPNCDETAMLKKL
jgi:amino-acid N-acetyltransferase